MSVQIIRGDCLDVLKTLPDASVDSVVTDPPYGLEFMGKAWDAPWKDARTDKRGVIDPEKWGGQQDGAGGNAYSRSRIRTAAAHYRGDAAKVGQLFGQWCETWAVEVLRVLKPGGYLLAFGGTRTYHRLACAIEDAGFEIRDQIGWAFGSGFPKSLDVSKAIDKAAGAQREVVGVNEHGSGAHKIKLDNHGEGDTGIGYMDGSGKVFNITEPATEAAKQWQGWGTALKPAWEPIVMARKPLIGTVAANVQQFGTGGLNIDGCRVEYLGDADKASATPQGKCTAANSGSVPNIDGAQRSEFERPEQNGRWPANLIHDGSEEVLACFPQSKAGTETQPRGTGGIWSDTSNTPCGPQYGDTGSAARFFYCAKACRQDRNEGLDGMSTRPLNWSSGEQSPGTFQSPNTNRQAQNHHPTVKPTDLMRYLCRLVTPKGGTVLDPFMGSGSTGRGAIREGFGFIGIEIDPEYCEIARLRIHADAPLFAEVA